MSDYKLSEDQRDEVNILIQLASEDLERVIHNLVGQRDEAIAINSIVRDLARLSPSSDVEGFPTDRALDSLIARARKHYDQPNR